MLLKVCKECGNQVSTPGQFCPHCGKSGFAKKGMNGCLIAFLIFVGFGVLLSIIASLGSPTRVSNTPPVYEQLSEQVSPKVTAIRGVKLDFTVVSSSGGILVVNFTVQNPGAYTVKDLEITCLHAANSGTVIDSNVRTIYEIFNSNSHSKKRFPEFNMGFINSQAARTSCKVTDLTIVQ